MLVSISDGLDKKQFVILIIKQEEQIIGDIIQFFGEHKLFIKKSFLNFSDCLKKNFNKNI
jgi:hypothetical protein